MPSFTTLYRAIVMVAAGVILVKGWQLYGPPAEQVKSFVVRGVELASAAWSNVQPTEEKDAAPSADPRLAAIAPPPASMVVEPAPLFAALQNETQGVGADLPERPAVEPAPPETTSDSTLPAGVADRLPPLYSRLESLGGSDPRLAPWGSSGRMYRFCCRASLADTPAFARHFEAVAAEPIAAVEQVVAKVEAWRREAHDRTLLQ